MHSELVVFSLDPATRGHGTTTVVCMQEHDNVTLAASYANGCPQGGAVCFLFHVGVP